MLHIDKACKGCVQEGLCSRRTNAGNINKNEARTAGAKVASFLFILSTFCVIEQHLKRHQLTAAYLHPFRV